MIILLTDERMDLFRREKDLWLSWRNIFQKEKKKGRRKKKTARSLTDPATCHHLSPSL